MKRIVVLLLNFCMLFFCMGCKMCDDKLCDNEKIHLVERIQLNSVRFTPERFGEEKLETLLDYLYSTDKIISEQEIDESALLHDVVTIYYEDGERDMFCFHKIDDIWYMRQEDGTVIQDAAFISEYITHVENSGSISTVLSIPEKDLLTAFVPDGKLDERYVFTRKLQERLSQGMEKTEAEKSVREAMISEYLLYQYALQNGYEVDDTSAELMDQLTELCKTAENRQEAEQELEKVGISLEEYLEMQENLLVYDAAKQVIYEEKYYAYRHGDTVIGEHDCSDFTEYWNTFLLEVVGIEMEQFDLAEYEKVLDEAAAFANEISDNTVTVYLHNDNQFVVRAAISTYEQERNSVIGTELESKWPEISWNLVDKSYLSDEEYQVMLLQELQNGGGPDLILSENDGAWDVNAMMENGYLLDLSDFAGGEPDAEYLVGTLEAGQVSGIQYMWPLAVETPVFFGYKQTLEAVGLCEDFHDMQEFLEKAVEAQEITGKAIFENDSILEWLLYYGEEQNEGDFNKRKELLGNIEVVDTATTEMDVYGSLQALEAGTCLLGACGTYDPARMFMNMTQMDQNDLVIFSVPDWSGETKTIISRAIGVNANSKHPQLALAALQAFCTAKEIAFFWDDMPAQISVGWENMAGVYWYSVSESPYLDYAESMGSFTMKQNLSANPKSADYPYQS